MGPIAAILLAGGLVALFVGGYLKLKGGRITKTPLLPTGQAAGWPRAGRKPPRRACAA